MNDFTLLGYVLIIGTVLIMFLRVYYFNVIDEVANKEYISASQIAFIKLYPVICYFWILFAIVAQHYKAIPLYFEILHTMPTNRLVNSSEIDAAHKLINSSLLFNGWVFVAGFLVYTWYVIYGIYRKNKDIIKNLSE